MLQLDFINALYVIILFNLFLVATASFFIHKGKTNANKIFSLFLLAKLICFSNSFLFYNYNFAIENLTHLFFIGQSFDLLLGPLMLIYARILMRKSYPINWKFMIHGIPFVLHLIYMTFVFHSKNSVEKKELIESQRLFTYTFYIVNQIIIYLSFVIYGFFILREITFYHKKLKSIYSNLTTPQMNWLIAFILGLCAIWLMAIFNAILSVYRIGITIPIWIYIISIFLFANMIFFYGIKYAESFSGINNKTASKYKKTLIPENKVDEILKKLMQYTEVDKPYLDPDINITKIADKLKIPSYQISQLLNSKLNKNFFEFISYYRIRESIEKLSDPNNNLTILEVLYESGFNSKSAFNNAFKKHTGITPSQFRKQPENITFPSLLN